MRRRLKQAISGPSRDPSMPHERDAPGHENPEDVNRDGPPSTLSRLVPYVSRSFSLTRHSRPATPATPAEVMIPAPADSGFGLHLVHDVSNPVADLILVHGLGGSWLNTWSWKHDARLFWPEWLPREDGLARVRVFSFGYNADFKGPHTEMGILDFAKQLLLGMAGYGGGEEEGGIGTNPIMFVAHSMGGLVVKKAYILGTLDDAYADMISRVFGVIFLATPHRGSGYSRILNNILSVSGITNAKVYVAELEAMSPTLRDINEQFRLVCKSLRLVSFYETLRTRVGSSKVLIVERDSAVLGYPSEVSSSMNADHHNVSKFSSREDSNYIALRGVIRGFVTEILGERPTGHQPADTHSAVQTLAQFLGVHDVAGLDKHQEMDGTCLWIQSRDYYATWAQPSDEMTRLLWLTGLPGMGKSTLAQATVNNLKNGHGGCQYHFFTFADQEKQTAAYALRNIAFQLALQDVGFSQSLVQLQEATQLRLGEQKLETIWSRVFEGIIFKTDFQRPLYWVFDALDESDRAVSLVNHLFKAKPKSPIRIFLTSRPDSFLLNLAQSDREFLTHVPLTARDTEDDLKLFISARLQDIPISAQARKEMAQTLLSKAAGLFVWVKLALNTLEQAWHTEDDMQRALNDMPQGMESLFNRMASTITATKDTNPRNHTLALRILSWATCSAEPLATSQLAAALEPEFTKLHNPEATILHLCRHFLTVSADGKVTPIHETAKAFLLGTYPPTTPPSPTSQPTPALLSAPSCHAYLATICLTYLSNPQWRAILSAIPDGPAASQNRARLRVLTTYPFLPYAASHWGHHLAQAGLGHSEALVPLLRGFLTRHVLAWIHACVAVLGELRVVTRTARALEGLAGGRGGGGDGGGDGLLDRRWATDLVRVVGRFGRHLTERPRVVYDVVPALCPRGSAVFEAFAGKEEGGFALRGLSRETWDDCVARVPVGGERTVSRVVCAGGYFVCLVAGFGEVVVCYAETGEEKWRMVHGEDVTAMAVDGAGMLVATAGSQTLRVWDIGRGVEVHRVTKVESERVIGMVFGVGGGELMVGYDNCVVAAYEILTGHVAWEFRAGEDGDDGQSYPLAMVFSPDATKLATASRNGTVLVWDLAKPPGERPTPRVCAGGLVKKDEDARFPLDVIVWHPDGLSMFILYRDSTIVRWFFTNNETVEVETTAAQKMAVSPAGGLLLTADYVGALSLWRLPDFRLLYRHPYSGLGMWKSDLAFSPDSQRLYGVHGPICNIWEPDVLLRDVEADRSDVEIAELNGTALAGLSAIAWTATASKITAISYDPTNQYCACGTVHGSVSIFDAAEGSKLREVYIHPNRSTVFRLAWSPTGRYMASSDRHGRVLAKRLRTAEREGTRTWLVLPRLDLQGHELAPQLLFHGDERLLLVVFLTSYEVWDLETGTKLYHHRWQDVPWSRSLWLNHPAEKNMLICLSRRSTTIHNWNVRGHQPCGYQPSGESERNSMTFPFPPVQPPPVERAALSQNRRYLVAQCRVGGLDATHRLELVHLEAWTEATEGSSITRDRELLRGMSPSVRHFLGCYKDHVVFLDREYWVCTWPLGPSPVRAIKRHFFLPLDYVSREAMALATLTEAGTVLLPKDGELVVISNGLTL